MRIYLLLNADGSIKDVSVLAEDQRSRLLGFKLIEELSEEILVFEGRVKTKIARLTEAQ
jgi:hypothetical protein